MIAGKCSGYHIYDNKEQSPRGFPGMNMMKTDEIEENHMGTSLTRQMKRLIPSISHVTLPSNIFCMFSMFWCITSSFQGFEQYGK